MSQPKFSDPKCFPNPIFNETENIFGEVTTENDSNPQVSMKLGFYKFVSIYFKHYFLEIMRFHGIIIILGGHWVPNTRMRQNHNFK